MAGTDLPHINTGGIDTQNSSLPPSGSNDLKSFALKKRVYSSKKFKESIKSEFKLLAKTPNPINEDRIKEIFDEVFYDIPHNGKNSYENVTKQSYEHLYRRYLKRIEKDIRKTIEDIGGKDKELNHLQNSYVGEHPVYADGSIIMVGALGVKSQDHHEIWIMQEGKKRQFANMELFELAKKALSLPPNTSHDGRYYLSVSEVNSITDGTTIHKQEDLNLRGDALITEDIADLLAFTAWVEVEFECLGSEVSDYVDALQGEHVTIQTLQFYLNSHPCVLKYIVDDATNDDTPAEVELVFINKGDTKVIKILREGLSDEDTGIPTNINDLYDEHGAFDANNITYNGNDISNYIAEWGPYGKYSSVIYAEGRINYREIYNAYISETLQQPQGESLDYRIFNGLPDSTTGVWTNANIQIIDSDNYSGQQESAYNTKMISNREGQFGNLGQESGLQSKVFNSPSNSYYKEEWKSGDRRGRIYGQPILRWDNAYHVLLDAYKSGNRKAYFINLENGDLWKMKRTKIQDNFGLTMSYSGGTIHHINWNTLDTGTRLKYPGLQGWRLNEHNVDENYFNPNANGSNYKLNSYNTW